MSSYQEIYDQWKRVYTTTDGTGTDSKYGGCNKPHSTSMWTENQNRITGLDGMIYGKEHEAWVPVGRTMKCSKLEIKNVIFNGPATIVLWADGTKTVVKCGNMDIYDPEKGLAMAICKYVFGNDGRFKRIFRKWLPEEDAGDELKGTPLGDLGSIIRKIFSPASEDEEK